MIQRKTKLQLIAFVAISAIAVGYALYRFTDVREMFGQRTYTVAMQMHEPGGIFPAAEVSYRGLNVGEVGDMRLTETGLEIDLVIEPGTPAIPADLDAVVMNRSAIGEQFVDLRPRQTGAPYLEGGSVISADRTKTPPGAEEVIDSTVQLADSVPAESLRTVVSESFDAFSGTADDLRLLMNASSEFIGTAQENLPPTLDLLEHGNTVLRAMNDESASIASFSEDLKLLSETLKGSDADIRTLIDNTPASARQLSEVVHDIGPGLSSLIADLITLGRIGLPRLEGTEQTLLTYPALAAGALAVPQDGQARLGFVLSLWDPPSCVRGYEGTERRPGTDTSPRPHNTEAYCAEPSGSPINVRGSQNVPFGGVSDHPTEADVAEHQDRDRESLRQQRRDSESDPQQSQGQGLAMLSTLLR